MTHRAGCLPLILFLEELKAQGRHFHKVLRWPGGGALWSILLSFQYNLSWSLWCRGCLYLTPMFYDSLSSVLFLLGEESEEQPLSPSSCCHSQSVDEKIVMKKMRRNLFVFRILWIKFICLRQKKFCFSHFGIRLNIRISLELKHTEVGYLRNRSSSQ